MKADGWLKSLRRLMDSPGGALLGGAVYGGWALWVNWPADHSLAIEAAAMHTLLSAAITLLSVAVMRRLFALGPGPRSGFLISAGGSLGITYTVLLAFHLTLGTPHPFLTLLPGVIPTVGFDAFYSYLLAREAGFRMRSGRGMHATA